tara:strand:- start:468 stop:833 length:366 start_codon:yes stop_codon:yes gene_type:complete
MRGILKAIWNKMTGVGTLTDEQRRRQFVLQREDEAAWEYFLARKAGENPKVEDFCYKYEVTRQGLINGWMRFRMDRPPFLTEEDNERAIDWVRSIESHLGDEPFQGSCLSGICSLPYAQEE